jgi:hypothetical protein
VVERVTRGRDLRDRVVAQTHAAPTRARSRALRAAPMPGLASRAARGPRAIDVGKRFARRTVHVVKSTGASGTLVAPTSIRMQVSTSATVAQPRRPL